jgi:hypothetical protein
VNLFGIAWIKCHLSQCPFLQCEHCSQINMSELSRLGWRISRLVCIWNYYYFSKKRCPAWKAWIVRPNKLILHFCAAWIKHQACEVHILYGKGINDVLYSM